MSSKANADELWAPCIMHKLIAFNLRNNWQFIYKLFCNQQPLLKQMLWGQAKRYHKRGNVQPKRKWWRLKPKSLESGQRGSLNRKQSHSNYSKLEDVLKYKKYLTSCRCQKNMGDFGVLLLSKLKHQKWQPYIISLFWDLNIQK